MLSDLIQLYPPCKVISSAFVPTIEKMLLIVSKLAGGSVSKPSSPLPFRGTRDELEKSVKPDGGGEKDGHAHLTLLPTTGERSAAEQTGVEFAMINKVRRLHMAVSNPGDQWQSQTSHVFVELCPKLLNKRGCKENSYCIQKILSCFVDLCLHPGISFSYACYVFFLLLLNAQFIFTDVSKSMKKMSKAFSQVLTAESNIEGLPRDEFCPVEDGLAATLQSQYSKEEHEKEEALHEDASSERVSVQRPPAGKGGENQAFTRALVYRQNYKPKGGLEQTTQLPSPLAAIAAQLQNEYVRVTCVVITRTSCTLCLLST